MSPLRKLDALLDKLPMYRLLLYGLSVLAGISLVFGFTGELPLSGPALLASLTVLVATCAATNFFLGRAWHIASNRESSLITGLILYCILPPSLSSAQLLTLVIAGIAAVASKYLLAPHRKHLFNPAAFGAVVVGLLGLTHATWWVGSPAITAFVLLLGLLVVRKTRRVALFGWFVLITIAVSSLLALHDGFSLGENLKNLLLSSPLIFLGSIMATEPATLPTRRNYQFVYMTIIAGLAVSELHVGWLAATPEIALIIGNLFSYAVNPKRKVLLRLAEHRQLSARIHQVSFMAEQPLDFLPGQYVELTLGHSRSDGRGNRRTFTIASSPTEGMISFGTKVYEPSSSFKKALLALPMGGEVVAGVPAGEFTLPRDPKQKLAFIAGGIGITPFRSMIKQLTDARQTRDIVLFYLIGNAEEYSYEDILRQAAPYGVRVVPILTSRDAPASWTGRRGRLTEALLREVAPDYRERSFYISGPQAMVQSSRGLLRGLRIRRGRIKTDYFSGY